ncbi:MAG: adenylate/guanylate cyclase domain-containing protein [Planctomycetes bacterium]|nr:adenylate/guanylate cyclase domain-containing protein [Planctomycetota bacterium]
MRIRIKKVFIGLAIGLISAILAKVLFTAIPFLSGTEILTLDYRFKLFAEPSSAAKDIVIIAIDQLSLDYMEDRGEEQDPVFWPWNRAVYAAAVDYLSRGKPKAIIFDITLKRTDEEGDDLFAKSIKNAGNVYCPMVFTQEKNQDYAKTISPQSKELLLNKFSIDVPNNTRLQTPIYNMAHPPNEILLPSPKRLGSVNIDKDKDGVLRKIPLLFSYENNLFPSLSLAVALDMLTSTGIFISDNNELSFSPAHKFPLTPQGEMYIWWRGPAKSYSYISFRTIYANWYDTLQKKSFESKFIPEYFKDKIVFIGSTAPSHGDLHSVPTDNIYPGVEAQATVLDNLLSGQSLRPATNTVNWIITLLLCALCGFVMFAFPSFLGGVISVAVAGIVFIVINLSLFAGSHYWLDMASPMAGLCLTFTGATVVYYFSEGKEKRRIKTTFSKYVSPDVVDEILRDYKGIKADTGQRKGMTILFSDIRGFTNMSESIPPEQVVSLLNEYLTLMVEVIFRHGGTLDKYIGDGIMAFFGAPKEQVNHARLAVLTAVEMVRESRRLEVKWKAEGKPNLNIGIGINTGDAVVGNIGSEKRLDYTVIGDNVNLAARLEPLNKEYKTNIVISESTARMLGDEFKLKELGTVNIRGKEKPIKIYEVIIN